MITLLASIVITVVAIAMLFITIILPIGFVAIVLLSAVGGVWSAFLGR